MYSKRVRRIVQIVGFLFCTIGLLYISMQILNTSKEGFQSADNIFATSCTQVFTEAKDKIFWLCATDNDAQAQVRNLISTGNIHDGVCYTTFEGFYTCYTRPSQKTYDNNEGIFVTDDPSSDGMPSGIESDIINVCGDYGTTMNTFKTIYVSTVAIGGVIQSTLNTIAIATTDLGQISTSYCASGASRSDAEQNTCDVLSTGISIFNGLPNGPKGLKFMSTTVQNAISNMENLYENNLLKAYKGFGYSTCNFSTFTDF
jgi:hypothetical protein